MTGHVIDAAEAFVNRSLSQLQRAVFYKPAKLKTRDKCAEDWDRAEMRVRFYETLQDFIQCCMVAQKRGVSEAHRYHVDEDYRLHILHETRVAIRELLLTPAPNKAALKWKCARLDRAQRRNLYLLGFATVPEVVNAIKEDGTSLGVQS